MDEQQVYYCERIKFYTKVALSANSPKIRELAWQTVATMTVILYLDHELLWEHLGIEW